MDEGEEAINYRAFWCMGDPQNWWTWDQTTFQLDPYPPPTGYATQILFPSNFEERGDDTVAPYPPGGHWVPSDADPYAPLWIWEHYDFVAVENGNYWQVEGTVSRHEYWSPGEEGLLYPPMLPLPLVFLSFMMLSGGAGGKPK